MAAWLAKVMPDWMILEFGVFQSGFDRTTLLIGYFAPQAVRGVYFRAYLEDEMDLGELSCAKFLKRPLYWI